MFVGLARIDTYSRDFTVVGMECALGLFLAQAEDSTEGFRSSQALNLR